MTAAVQLDLLDLLAEAAAEEPRPICNCRNDGDRHPRLEAGCTGGDPRISRVKPWGARDEADRAKHRSAVAVPNAPAVDELDEIIECRILAWHIEQVAAAPTRKERTKLITSIGRYYAEGMGSGTFGSEPQPGRGYNTGKKGISVHDWAGLGEWNVPGSVWDRGHLVAAGELPPVDGVPGIRLYTWRQLLERAVELRASDEPQAAQQVDSERDQLLTDLVEMLRSNGWLGEANETPEREHLKVSASQLGALGTRIQGWISMSFVQFGRAGVVYYERIIGGRSRDRAARIEQIAHGKLVAAPEDEVHVFTWAEVIDRALPAVAAR